MIIQRMYLGTILQIKMAVSLSPALLVSGRRTILHSHQDVKASVFYLNPKNQALSRTVRFLDARHLIFQRMSSPALSLEVTFGLMADNSCTIFSFEHIAEHMRCPDHQRHTVFKFVDAIILGENQAHSEAYYPNYHSTDSDLQLKSFPACSEETATTSTVISESDSQLPGSTKTSSVIVYPPNCRPAVKHKDPDGGPKEKNYVLAGSRAPKQIEM